MERHFWWTAKQAGSGSLPCSRVEERIVILKMCVLVSGRNLNGWYIGIWAARECGQHLFLFFVVREKLEKNRDVRNNNNK